MTHKQYSNINRCLGKLEGIGVAIPEIAAVYYFDTIEALSTIIEELRPQEEDDVTDKPITVSGGEIKKHVTF